MRAVLVLPPPSRNGRSRNCQGSANSKLLALGLRDSYHLWVELARVPVDAVERN